MSKKKLQPENRLSKLLLFRMQQNVRQQVKKGKANESKR